MFPGPVASAHRDTIGEKDYEAFIAEGDSSFAYKLPGDEWDAIALGYTSGTTGDPKGVVTHHRGAYLNGTFLLVSFLYALQLPGEECVALQLWCASGTTRDPTGAVTHQREADLTSASSLISV